MTAANRHGRARTRAPRFTSSILLVATTLAIALAAPAGSLTLHDTGRWTPPHGVGRTAIHMALLRGHGPYGAEVIWWYGLNDEQGPFAGGMLGWKPTEHDCGSWSASDTTFLAPITLPTPAVNVFCGSNSVMADGKLFVAGGTQSGTEFGLKRANIFDWASLQWTEVDSMALHRWYATSTSLPTGAQLVSSGSDDHFLKFFGGLVNADAFPLDSALFRYGDGAGGKSYDPARLMAPDTLWPSPREGHTLVMLGSNTAHMFGGKNRVGRYLNDYWQLNTGNNTLGADFDYKWSFIAPHGSPPRARWDHSAVPTPGSSPTWMFVFGGIAKSSEDTTLDVVMSDVWRLWYSNSFPVGSTWSQVSVQSPNGSPGARCGHIALWRNPTQSDLSAGIHGRMLVFGGRGSTTGSPTDSSLWSLNFNDALLTTATWESLTATGPSPRFHAAIGYQYDRATHVADTAFVFGGETAYGPVGDLWRLNTSTLTWDPVNYLQGTPPTARSRATATLEGRLLLVFGGRSDDSTVHVAQLGGINGGQAQTWVSYHPHSPALSGHVAFFEGGQWARTPEVFSPSGSWTRLGSAPHLQTWYPQGFVWKADTVFFSGPELLSYKLAMNSPQTWKQFPDSSSGFLGGTAVMYRPGKVMKCGSSDWEVQDQSVTAVGATKSLDLSAPDSAQWRPSTNPMQPRENHNLVLLPNGKVLVVGGSSKDGGAEPKYGPEIWDPDYNNGQGQWSGYGTLAPEHRIRDYHSTALLLPDGRILSGGGNVEATGRDSLEIFCPPYLFKSDGTLATRPGIGGVVQRVRYGGQFTVCMSSSDTISSVGLVRAGAVTHGFDQNQRYVPLTFTPHLPFYYLTATAPADSFVAPPGDYLLFLVNTKGVPSIARWLRVGSVWNEPDTTLPDSVADLGPDAVSQNTIYWVWTVPGDDHASGQPWQHKLVHSASPITATSFANASPVPDQVPLCAGGEQNYQKDGLAACHYYYAAIQVVDESNNYSPIGYSPPTRTLCTGGGGGGASAHAAREEGAGGAAPAGASPAASLRLGATAASLDPAGATGVLVADYLRSGTTVAWTLYRADPAGLPGAVALDPGRITFQAPDGAGGWRTRRELDDLPTDLGLRAATPRGRVVLPATYALSAIETRPPGFDLVTAHSALLGALATDSSATTLGVTLAAGDTLSLTFAPATAGGERGEDCFFIASRPLTASESSGRRPLPDPEQRRLVFALHQNIPNPFAATTAIGFSVPMASRVRLEVYDLLGRKVRTLANATFSPGEHQVVWDRRTASGALAAPGLYFYRMEAGEYREKRRMVILP